MKLKITNFIPVLLASVFICSCADQEEIYADSSSASLLRIAESMQKFQDFATAKKLYQQILDASPHHVGARLGLAAILTEEGKRDEAIQLLEETSTLHPQHLPVLKALGKAYIAANKGDKCEIIYKKMYGMQPEDALILNGLGICSDLKSQHTQAQMWYTKALEIDHHNINIQSNLGLSLALDGKIEEGINYLTKLSQHPKATPNVKHNLAVAYALAGDNQKANQYFKYGLDQESIQRNINFLSSLNSQEASTLTIKSSKLESREISKTSTKKFKNKKKTHNKKLTDSSKTGPSLPQKNPENSSAQPKTPATNKHLNPPSKESLLNNNDLLHGFSDLTEERI
ncbi:hypothetical protein IM40_03470 [Candidatus Paracaedimonas acanthamoebae]|nr:hypothetical protein IM40_03470 [Candidatus Paracaedimonas acanthamoebae]